VRKGAPLVLALSILAILAPLFVANTFASGCSTPCQVQFITHVPTADRPSGVRVQLGASDGSGIFVLNYTFAWANNTVHTITVLDTYFVGAVSGKVYRFNQWIYTGTGLQLGGPSYTTSHIYTNYTTATCRGTLNCPFLADFTVSPPLGCSANCNLDAITNVPQSDGTIKVQVDGGPTVYSLGPSGYTFPFPNGTIHTIQVLNTTFTGKSSNARYVWKQWSCSCNDETGTPIPPTVSLTLTTPKMYLNYTIARGAAFTAQFDEQFQLSLTFTDQKGNVVGPPTSLQLVNGNTVVNLTSYSGLWESAVVWSVRNVVWEGAYAIEVPGQTIDMTGGPVARPILLRAYSATIKVVDSSGNPVVGASVAVSFDNATTRTFLTDSQGLVQLGFVPLGPYTTVVTYKGTTYCNCVTDASQMNPNVVQIPVGSAPTTSVAVSSAVLLAIFGLAAFLLILAIKVRKPSPPPTI
jgi:hypothetical protein